MAIQSAQDFEDVVLLISDGAGTPSFASPCGFDTLTLSRTSNVDTSTLYDCTDRTAAGVEVSTVRSVTQTLSGSGTISKVAIPSPAFLSDAKTWLNAVGTAADIRLVFFSDGATNATPTALGYYSLSAIVENFSNANNKGNKGTFDVNLILNSALNDTNWTDGAPA